MLPAVQVYFCATLDAVIAGLLFVCIAAFCRAEKWGVLLGGMALLAASFLTFGVVWVVPVLIAAESARRRLPWRTLAVLVAGGLVYGLVYLVTGFHYGAAFRFASASENPDVSSDVS